MYSRYRNIDEEMRTHTMQPTVGRPKGTLMKKCAPTLCIGACYFCWRNNYLYIYYNPVRTQNIIFYTILHGKSGSLLTSHQSNLSIFRQLLKRDQHGCCAIFYPCLSTRPRITNRQKLLTFYCLWPFILTLRPGLIMSKTSVYWLYRPSER